MSCSPLTERPDTGNNTSDGGGEFTNRDAPFDLNTPAAARSQVSREVVMPDCEQEKHVEEDGRTGQSDPPATVVERPSVQMDDATDGGAPSSTAVLNDVVKEVAVTIEVGSSVGFQPDGFQREGVRDSRKVDWVRGLKTSHGVHFLAVQETKMGVNANFRWSRFWGRSSFEFDIVEAVGNSGGLVSMWNPAVFSMTGVLKHKNFLMVSGCLKATGEQINIVNVYAQNDPIARRRL
ncbi:uncharacterized protein LOC110888636 [Helianthus annuus]|uniref:uncharacterized protein LOC110888636 n=1 Tax=Helianthus annuus TaxID=4232 RepID=UPI001652F0DB|nr:uncharacterized protein LOC110888636 [Helianthus annuus]